MSLATRQLLIAVVVGIAVAILVVRLARDGRLSFRYAVGWLSVASLGILSGFFIPLAEPIAERLGLSAAALLGLAAVVFVTVIAIQLSISISGLQNQVRTLAEEVARLRHQKDQRP